NTHCRGRVVSDGRGPLTSNASPYPGAASESQILCNQEGFALALVLAEIADRLAGAVFDIAHFAINTVLLGQPVEQVHGNVEVGIPGRRLADAQLPVLAVVALALIDQSDVVCGVGLGVRLRASLQVRQVLPEFLVLLVLRAVAGDQKVYEHSGGPVCLSGYFTMVALLG